MQHQSWLKRLTFGLLVVVMVTATACGAGGAPAAQAPDGGAEASGEESSAPEDTSEMTAAESAERDIPRSRTLILNRPDNSITDFQQMNPYALGGLGRIRDTLNKTIYEFLFYYNHNDGEIIPWLATDFEYNEDFTEITINLRDGVEWSDGEAFTAEDVEYTLELVRDTSTFVFSSQMEEWIDDVEVVDDLTLRIHLTKSNPRWVFFYLAENSEVNMAILPEHIWSEQDPESFNNFDLEQGWPVGTGPYRLVRATELRHVFDLRTDWWAAQTGFSELPEPERFIRIPGGSDPASRSRLFAQNEVDFGHALQVGDFEAARGRNPNLIAWFDEGPVWGTADACTYILGLNTSVEPYSNLDVRWAINHAIDRDRLVELAYENSTVPMYLPLSSFGRVQEYAEQVEDLVAESGIREHNLDLTDELMTGAGFTKDDEGFWTNEDGERIEMTLSTTGGRRPIGPPLAQMLRDAGFDAIARHDETEQVTTSIRDGTQETWIDPHCGASREPFPTFDHFTSKYSAPVGESTGYRWANSRYENPEYDAILAEMESMQPSPDDEQYVELFQQAAEIWLNDLPEIVLAEERHVWTYNTTCWEGWPQESDPYIAPYDLWGAFMLAMVNLESTGQC